MKQRTAQHQAKQLGVLLFENDTDMFIPCQFSLFRQLFTLRATFLPLTKRGLFVVTNYQIKCDETDPMELINLALQRDVSKMKTMMLGVDDTRYMKLENVVMENTKVVRLSCRLTRPIDCSFRLEPVVWRTPTGRSFTRRIMPTERIYMNEACELVIQSVEVNDSGVYQCFIRDVHNPTTWSRTPKVAYRLKVEKANYELPDMNEVIVGLIILISWSICVVVLWIMLLIYNQQISLTAIAVAKCRQRRNEETAGVSMDEPIDTESPI